LCGQAGKEEVSMPEQRRVVWLEAVAAAVILTMVVLVLCMIFVYKPG
jgi:hypothetical protein